MFAFVCKENLKNNMCYDYFNKCKCIYLLIYIIYLRYAVVYFINLKEFTCKNIKKINVFFFLCICCTFAYSM